MCSGGLKTLWLRCHGWAWSKGSVQGWARDDVLEIMGSVSCVCGGGLRCQHCSQDGMLRHAQNGVCGGGLEMPGARWTVKVWGWQEEDKGKGQGECEHEGQREGQGSEGVVVMVAVSGMRERSRVAHGSGTGLHGPTQTHTCKTRTCTGTGRNPYLKHMRVW